MNRRKHASDSRARSMLAAAVRVALG